VTSFTSKNQWKKHIFSSNLFKNEDFFKISKTNDYLNYLKKLVEQNFSKTLFDASESAKTLFFCDFTKVGNFWKKKCYIIEREPEKSI
jgi:hypothetical protein